MPKRRSQDKQNQRGSGGGDLAGKRSRPARRRKHLYLVLDDWKKGFSVHKIDTDSFDSDDSDDDDVQEPRAAVTGCLPEPPTLRLETAVPYVDMFFTAMRSKIFIITDASHGQSPALVFDAETEGLAIGPAVPAHLECGFDIVVAANDTLYAFSSPSCNKQQSFKVMSWVPAAWRDDTLYPSEESWSWKSLPAPPPPFDIYEIITSYAVHPDGHTIFMTTSFRDRPNLQKSTYSFNTKYCVWRWHDWVLPFRGRGFFDRELDAWVGIRCDGYICSCEVASDIGSETPIELCTTQLDGQVVEDKLLCKETETHLRASLTYMGRSKFCLIQSVIRKGAKERYPLGDDDGCMLHLTIFGLRYNQKGELRATNHRSTRSYRVSRHKDYFFPEAFWV